MFAVYWAASVTTAVPLDSAGSDRSDDAGIENTSATCGYSIETQSDDWQQRFTSTIEWRVVDCIIMHPRKTGPGLQAVDSTPTMILTGFVILTMETLTHKRNNVVHTKQPIVVF